MPGVHRREGIFIAAGPGLSACELPTLSLAQAGALVWALVGLSPPAHAAALPPYLRDLAQGLMPPNTTAVPAKGAAPAVMTAQGARPLDAYGEEERAALMTRLRALGYID